jgi:hypothetical protein
MSDKRKYHAYYRNVMNGSLNKTPGGLSKKDIVVITNENKFKKNGSPALRYVSKEKHENGVKNKQYIAGWATAVKDARDDLGIQGFQVIGGKTVEGKELYNAACKFYGKPSKKGCNGNARY